MNSKFHKKAARNVLLLLFFMTLFTTVYISGSTVVTLAGEKIGQNFKVESGDEVQGSLSERLTTVVQYAFRFCH